MAITREGGGAGNNWASGYYQVCGWEGKKVGLIKLSCEREGLEATAVVAVTKVSR